MRQHPFRATRVVTRLAAAFAIAVSAALAADARADGLIIVPPRPPEAPHLRNIPLAVKSHKVTVQVTDRVAVTDVDQVFYNPNPRALEGTYLFPLPLGAAIDRFSMWVDGKELSAELLDAAKARDIYEGIVRQMRDPALLEYADRGIFKARIFPIEANGEKRVRIRYAELLTADAGTVGYRYPLATERFSSKPLEQCSIDVTIEGSSPITSVWSPTHKVDAPTVTPGAATNRVRVGWETRGTLPDRDFLLYWRQTAKDVGIAALAHRDPSDPEGTFLLVLGPKPQADAAPMPKDVVFVFDTSGSMAGAKMEQARAALRFCVRSLGADDRFGIVPFATEPRPFAATLQPASPENRAAAEKFVDALEARGGTAIDDALRASIAMFPAGADGARPRFVVFMTDGDPTIGETDPAKIVKNALAAVGRAASSSEEKTGPLAAAAGANAARIFVFGVGNQVNAKLLDTLSDETRGTRDYVAETESIEEKVSNLWTKVSKPAMTDVSIRIDGVATSAVHPAKLPDLFHGAEMLVAGRYAIGGNAVIRVSGRVRGQPVEIVEEVKFPEAEARHEFLPRLWAVRRVGFLLDEIRLRGESAEVKDEVVRLAKRFGIVTPYTSYLILEDSQAVGRAPGLRPRTADLPGDPFRGGLDGASPGGDTGGAPHTGGGRKAGSGPGGGVGGGGGGSGGGAAPAAPAASEDAVEELKADARRAGEARSKDSGKGAVDLSRDSKNLRDFEGHDADGPRKEGGAADLLRHVEGRTFSKRGDLWWDMTADPAKARRKIEAFSDDYFALVKAHPELAKWVVLGHVVVVVGDEVLEFLPATE
ncbi:MAG: VIT and VWA domain-containing protein [Planctomycetes bacterium]|nr:VIT and VWA domain-containing protein [Planctomycetota bacterium]